MSLLRLLCPCARGQRLPENWKRIKDEKGNTMYWNTARAAHARAPSARPSRAPPCVCAQLTNRASYTVPEPLEEGWHEARDSETGAPHERAHRAAATTAPIAHTHHPARAAPPGASSRAACPGTCYYFNYWTRETRRMTDQPPPPKPKELVADDETEEQVTRGRCCGGHAPVDVGGGVVAA